jgi:NDP-sugar pyrophosphorylase family protein
MIRHALIMAAGRGARMKPLTDSIPKPMAPYNGSTLIADGIRKLQGIIENIHVTVGYKGALLAKHVINIGVNSVFDTNERGNSWWIYNTLMKQVDEPTIVLTADNVTVLDFELISREYGRLGNPACMLVPVKPVKGLEGDYIHQQNNLVIELSRIKPSPIYCSGIQVLNPKVINEKTIQGDDFNDVWGQLISQKSLYSSNVYPKNWFTVDTIDHLDTLNS